MKPIECRGDSWIRAEVSAWMPRLWLAIALIVPRMAIRAELTVHAVMDRFGAATSFVNDSGQLWAWGANAVGQYGDGTTNLVVTARKLAFPDGVTRWKVFRTGARYLALDQDGRLFAWGEPEQVSTDSHAFFEPKATLLGTNLWLDVVTPEIANGPAPAPFGLGIDSAGTLLWLRAPQQASPQIPPLNGFRVEPTSVSEPGLVFASVSAGAHGFLALSTSGRLFAAGLPFSGIRGPNAPTTGTNFSAVFFEVPPPVVGTTWTRTAVVGETAFGWIADGKLYTWGLENPPSQEGDLVANPNPTLTGSFPGVSSWKTVQGFGGVAGELISVDNRGLVHAISGPLAFTSGAGIGWSVNMPILQLPAGWAPVRSISQSFLHLLVYGNDGKVHAVGDNNNFELGQPDGGSASNGYKPVVPAGNAPFLSGAVAPFSTIDLEVLDDLIVEPDAPTTTNFHSGKLRIHSTAGPLNAGLLKFQVATRLTNGLPNPNPDAAASLVRFASGPYPLGYYNNAGGVMDFDVTPLFNDSLNTPLLVDVTLLPDFDYYPGQTTSATFRYQPTEPLNHPPHVRLVWPPLKSRVFYASTLDFLLEVSDPDGYVARAGIGLLFTQAGNLNSVSASFPPVPAGSTNLVRVQLKPLEFLGVAYPTISVVDDRGQATELPHGNSQSFGAFRMSVTTYSVTVRGQTIPLEVPSNAGVLELQGSDDLKVWSTLARYSIPTPGLPKSPVAVESGPGPTRYYRLANPDAP